MNFLGVLLCLVICISFSCGIHIPHLYLKHFKRWAIDIIDKAGPKDECSRQLKAWIGDLFNYKRLWAMQMLDASAKLQTGLLTGNVIHWGNYDQCLEISEDKGNDGIIEGQYCTVALLPVKNASSHIAQYLDLVNFLPEVMGVQEGKEFKHLPKILKVLLGICLPKSCGAENMQTFWDYIEYTFRLPFHVSLNVNFCSHKGKVPHQFYFDKYVIWSFGLFFVVICCATVYDLMTCQRLKEMTPKLWEKIFTSFSAHKNFKSIFHYPPANSVNALSCINGLKVFSMLWVIFGHSHVFGYLSGNTNMIDYFEWRKGPIALIVLLTPFAVDTFLIISGLLLAYKYMEIRSLLPQGKSIPYSMFYFVRFLRLWPALFAAILFNTSIIKYLNSGPLWTMLMNRVALTCSYTGWLTSLFMTNMVEFKYQCIEPTWYLAVDTQLYCIAPVFLYFLYKYPKKATIVFVFMSFISALYAYWLTVKTKIKWSPSEGDERYQNILYQSTFVRIPSWIFGLLTGAFLYSYQQIRLSKTFNALMWMYIIMIWVGIAKVTNIMISTPYNEHSSGIYNALARQAWSLSICFLIFLCATGHGGIVNKTLSSNIYNVLAKFSYSTYLLHMAIILLVNGNKRAPGIFNSFNIFRTFLGDLPFIFAASIMWCLAFESPFMNIAKVLVDLRKEPFNKVAINDRKLLHRTVWEHKAIVGHSSKDKQFTLRKNK